MANSGIDLWTAAQFLEHYKKQTASSPMFPAAGQPVHVSGTVGNDNKTITLSQRSRWVNIYNNSNQTLHFSFDGNNYSQLFAFSAFPAPFQVDSIQISGTSSGSADYVITYGI